ncbi:MAG: sigma-70 family RNA polymerase sigma factor [Bacteroidales bacterium]|jgi:RNA polymerase sigma factor (sigma-70 family)|nr:sigma-70 family RNA polymerase sigma factor [Bacteroidales bacterium]
MKASNPSDQELIKRYLSGNESSLEIIINRHKHKVFSYILMVVKSPEIADDLFQDTFIKVINTLKSGTYNEEGKFIHWVMRIAHNLVIDYFRKKKRIPIKENTEERDTFELINIKAESIEDIMITDQIHKDLKVLIGYLPEEQKEVLLMRHYIGMSFKDIAEETDVSINTALGRMRYAILNIRRLVKENNISLSHSY